MMVAEERETSPKPRVLPHAPEELTRARLHRLGEGIGKVVYASDHWVVKRERSSSEILALIAFWKLVRKLERFLPARLSRTLLEQPPPSLRMLLHAIMAVVPKSVWYSTHLGEVLHVYRTRGQTGEALAEKLLSGSELIAHSITFPPTWVTIDEAPGELCVSEATERVEATLHHRLTSLARESRFDELETLLDRFLELRQAGWARGVFSVDAHLKNFGVIGSRIVLIDPGGLTDDWSEVESHLVFEEVAAQPHIQLGLGPALSSRPDIAARFNRRWNAVVNRATVYRHWSGRVEEEG
jgi:hypothetical protein